MADNNPFASGQGSSGLGDIVTQLKGIISQLSTSNSNMLALIATLSAVFPRITGTFTLATSATTVVTQPAIQANSVVQLTPTNAAAATLMAGAKSLYISALTPGASFTVATADGTNAAGTETFSYSIFNTA